ncbi:hypothetical protein RI138_24380 [Streptomyces sp. C11-1]|uniref:Syndecan 1 n=1 Tax=Streptomyces durocortorensis TaxID=2811104 RepID=A0ABY9W171_9ACTN|nr:hypothetical protein [Streptomyces durocortorensis]WNF29713.1 hypothetical protein RI138_24380 [Streptomyces durocortorensis]
MPVLSASAGSPAGSEPAAVQRAVDGDRAPARNHSATGTGTGLRTRTASSPATPPAPVRIRPIGPEREAARTSGGGAATPAVQRAKTLLPGRALTVNTGAAEGFSGPRTAAAGVTARPVVAATWRRDVPQAEPGTDAPSPGSGNRPTAHRRTAPQPPTPSGTVPGRTAPLLRANAAAASGGTVQRAVAAESATGTGGDPAGRRPQHRPSPAPAPTAGREPGRPAPPSRSARPVPVVRPHPPASAGPGEASVPLQRMALPVVPESAGLQATGPVPGGGAAPAPPPGLSARVPPRPPAPATARAVQRAAEAGITGVPVRAVQTKPHTSSNNASHNASAEPAETPPAANRLSGADMEELARRLLDPVSRLIRADLRRGRERAGRLHDGRR